MLLRQVEVEVHRQVSSEKWGGGKTTWRGLRQSCFIYKTSTGLDKLYLVVQEQCSKSFDFHPTFCPFLGHVKVAAAQRCCQCTLLCRAAAVLEYVPRFSETLCAQRLAHMCAAHGSTRTPPTTGSQPNSLPLPLQYRVFHGLWVDTKAIEDALLTRGRGNNRQSRERNHHRVCLLI